MAEVVDETGARRDSIRFAVPEELRETFKFKPGQHLTLKAEIEGEEVRRNYSLCVAPQDGQVMVTVKRIAGGVFSNWANDNLKPGRRDRGDGAARQLHLGFRAGAANHYVGFAGGSGITPVMSLLKTALLTEPDSRFTLFYGNRDSSSVIFLEALAQLKNRFMDRLQVHHFLAEEAEEFELFNGMLDRAKCDEMLEHPDRSGRGRRLLHLRPRPDDGRRGRGAAGARRRRRTRSISSASPPAGPRRRSRRRCRR